MLSTSKLSPWDSNALERPDLIPLGTRTDQHGQPGRSTSRRTARPARTRRFSFTTQIPQRSRRIRAGYWTGSNAKTCSPSSTNCFRPTLPIMRISSCQPLLNWSNSTFTVPTGISTCRPTCRRFAPLGEAKPNTEVFRLLAAAMGFEPELFQVSDEQLARSRLCVRPAVPTGYPVGRCLRRHHSGSATSQRPDSTEPAGRLRPVRPGKLRHANRQVRIIQPERGRRRSGSACRITSLRMKTRKRSRLWRRSIRCK